MKRVELRRSATPMKRSRLRSVSAKTRTQRWPALKAMRAEVLQRAGGYCEVCG